VKKLATIGKGVAALFAINFAALAVVGVVMASKGMLTREKVGEVVKVLRAPPAPSAPTAAPAETGPTSKPAELVPAPITLSERERVVAFVRTQLDAQTEELRQRQAMVDRARQQLEIDRAAFETERKAFHETVDATTQTRRQAGLRETLKTYAALKPDRIKALLAPLSDEELTEVLVGLEARVRAKVIEEFKTPEEVTRLQRVLKLIRDGAGAKVAADTAGAAPTP